MIYLISKEYPGLNVFILQNSNVFNRTRNLLQDLLNDIKFGLIKINCPINGIMEKCYKLAKFTKSAYYCQKRSKAYEFCFIFLFFFKGNIERMLGPTPYFNMLFKII